MASAGQPARRRRSAGGVAPARGEIRARRWRRLGDRLACEMIFGSPNPSSTWRADAGRVAAVGVRSGGARLLLRRRPRAEERRRRRLAQAPPPLGLARLVAGPRPGVEVGLPRGDGRAGRAARPLAERRAVKLVPSALVEALPRRRTTIPFAGGPGPPGRLAILLALRARGLRPGALDVRHREGEGEGEGELGLVAPGRAAALRAPGARSRARHAPPRRPWPSPMRREGPRRGSAPASGPLRRARGRLLTTASSRPPPHDRLLTVSRSWRRQAPRTPAGEVERPRSGLAGDPPPAVGRRLRRERDDQRPGARPGAARPGPPGAACAG